MKIAALFPPIILENLPNFPMHLMGTANTAMSAIRDGKLDKMSAFNEKNSLLHSWKN